MVEQQQSLAQSVAGAVRAATPAASLDGEAADTADGVDVGRYDNAGDAICIEKTWVRDARMLTFKAL